MKSTRRMTSRKVGLTAAFLALAAGGSAACDSSTEEDASSLRESNDSRIYGNVQDSPPYDGTPPTYDPETLAEMERRAAKAAKEAEEEARRYKETVEGDYTLGTDDPYNTDGKAETPYCADEEGVVVDPGKCGPETADAVSGSHTYYMYHSPTFPAGIKVGKKLPSGGSRFSPNDYDERLRFDLPEGKVSNGIIKTNIVGRGSGSSGYSSSDGSSSTSTGRSGSTSGG